MNLSTREGRRQQGERIKKSAKDAGLTLDELGRVIGCSRALIFQYASGASLAQTDRLQQIALAVGRPLYWFFLNETDAERDIPAIAVGVEQLSADRSGLDAERAQFAIERTAAEQRRIREDISHLEALLAAAESPADNRKVIECCQQLQPLLAIEVKDDPERLASVLLKQGNALIYVQELGAAKEKLEQASAIFLRIGSPVLERDCMQSLGHTNLLMGRVSEALQQFEYVAESDDWTNRWQGTLSIGAAHEMVGDFPAAIAAFEASLAIVDERITEPADATGTITPPPKSDTEIPRLYIEANWSNLEIDFGDYGQALERSQRCIRVAQRNGIQDQYIEALLTSGVAHLYLGKTRAASGLIHQALDVAQLTGDRQRHSLALSCLVLCDAAARQPDTAIAQGKEALALALRCNAQRAEILAQRALCEAYLASPAPIEALYHAQQGHAMAAINGLRTPMAQFSVLQARGLLITDRPAEAIAIALAALNEAEHLQIRPVQMDCHCLLSQANLVVGDLANAAQYAEKMVALAEAMQLRHALWRGHALAALSLPKHTRSASAHIYFATAAELLSEARRLDDANGESIVMEDPLAIDLWQSRLILMLESEGTEACLTLAQEADWPPLIDWLESRFLSEGGMPDA